MARDESRASRVDAKGAAYKGSQKQLQAYVNGRADELNKAILSVLPGLRALRPTVTWVSPLAAEKYAEYRDGDFLDALKIRWAARLLRKFWPKNGPKWDALARVSIADAPAWSGAILVEGKSYPEEMESERGCGASPPSRKIIDAALKDTARWLGTKVNAEWTGRLYQSANRLAHLYFLRELAHVPAWLVNVCFVNDKEHHPTDEATWRTALADVKRRMGLRAVETPHSADLTLPAHAR